MGVLWKQTLGASGGQCCLKESTVSSAHMPAPSGCRQTPMYLSLAFSSAGLKHKGVRGLILYFACCEAKGVWEERSLHQIWQPSWSLLIKTGREKGNRSLGNSIRSFNPLSRYFIFKTQVQPSAKLRGCMGPWGTFNFGASKLPPHLYLQMVPHSHFFYLGESPLAVSFLYSLETN